MRLSLVVLYAGVILAAGPAIPAFAQVPAAQWEPFEKPAAASSPPTRITADSMQADSGAFSATGKMPWDEYDKQVQGSGVVGTLGPDLFGDQVEFYKNTLSFAVTDITLPGNFALPVALTRKLAVTDRHAFDGNHDFPLIDWELDLPNISGVYAPVWADNRCSATQLPAAPVGSGYDTDDFWNGLSASMPSGGELLRPIVEDQSTPAKEAAPKPANGVTYPWMTAGFAYIRCIGAVGNATGEGFEALTPDGTRYTFGWMALNFQPDLRRPGTSSSQGEKVGYAPLVRRLNSMYVTRIEDRFGNTVTYTYDNAANAPVRLRSIQASDGRSVTLEYTGTTLTHATAHGRTWNYQYTGDSLSAVVLPDASRWTYDFRGLSNAIIDPDSDPAAPRSCNNNAYWIGGGGTGTVTHPSGAVGTFTVAPMRHGRSNVPKFCENWSYTNNSPNDDVSAVPRAYDVLSISRKAISGPGLVPYEWLYTGGSVASWTPAAYEPGYQPVCQASDCMEPVCVDDACAGKHTTSVAGREVGTQVVTDFQRITFGNSYRYNEGKLLKIERGANAGTILEVEDYAYNLAQAGQAFATPIGRSLQARAAGFPSEYLRPQSSKIITRDGVAFIAAVNFHDAFARPANVDRTSRLAADQSLRHSKNETTEYHDNPAGWVLGQVARTTTDGIEVARTDFDAKDRPAKTYSFDLLQQALTYDGDGTLRTVADGKGNTTTLSNWHRGIPRSMTLADASTLAAVVNDAGWITQATDELGTATTYDYDAMGRLRLTDYTNADPVPWASSQRTFAPITAAEYGVPAGSWKQAAWTGNGRTTTWYNARWQPVLALTEDTASTATRAFIVTRYDATGRAVFQSYPVGAMVDIALPLPGMTTEYDGLGRVTHLKQDSELAATPVLGTQTEYLAGFRARVTNPRGFATTTDYQAFDTPDTRAPIRITAPETQTTVIARDRFGKPLSITRSGTYAGSAVSATRSYVYDANERLCKTVEPESGATILDYDAAGNVAWSATGQSLTTLACNREGVAAAAKTTRTYDARNRIKVVNVPSSANDPTFDYYADGALKRLDNGGSRWDYTYNLRRLPVNETLTFGGKVRTLAHAYDGNGHEIRLTYPSGLVINHVPNALGQASQSSGFATGVTYFPNGGMRGFAYGACSGSPSTCVTHAMAQNLRQLPLRSMDRRGTGTPILDNTYAYDANGNVAGITDGGGNPGRTRDQLAYDGLDRLTHARAPSLSWINADIAYDPLDNIRSHSVGSRTWTYLYDASNRLATLLKPASTAVAHDANGNLIAHGAAGYTFDAANRLVLATGKESYAYDGHGRRVSMLRLSDGKAGFPMYSLAGKLVTEDDLRNNLTTDYVHLNGSLVAKRFKPIGGSTWTTRYLYTDALGTPVAETDAAGTVTKTEHYTPYGEQTDTLGGAALEQGPAFTGHVTDAATGLSYMQQRYYDPQIGRFLSLDPVTPDATGANNFNRYRYGDNNPYRFIDPDGRETNPVSGGAGISDEQLRTNANNPNVGKFGHTRSANNWNGGEHIGVDISAPVGTPLLAPISGTASVIGAENNPRGGNVVRVETQKEGRSVVLGMAHLSRVDVQSGDAVVEGQTQLGLSGDTGNARGLPADEQHVHLTVRVDGVLQDPQTHFRDNQPPASPPPPEPQPPTRLEENRR